MTELNSATPDRIIIADGLARTIIYGGDPDDWKFDEDFDEATLAKFLEEYEVVGNEFLGDPQESWYQGVTFTTVIRRKSDDKLYGFSYWKPIAKHSEPSIEANGYDFDDIEDDETFVFQPVESFPVLGYKIAQGSN